MAKLYLFVSQLMFADLEISCIALALPFLAFFTLQNAADSHEGLSAANDVERVLFDGDPDGFAFVLGGDDFVLEAVEPDVGVEHHALLQVLAYEDATFGVVRGVASVDADAAEHGDAKEDGQPLLHLRRERDDYGVAAFGDG